MSRTQLSSRKAVSTPMIVSSFIGVMMGIPVTLGVASLTNQADAVGGYATTAEATSADFAKFAYAFNQGYEARAVSATTGAAACVDVPGMGSAGAGTASAAAYTDEHPAVQSVSYGGRGSMLNPGMPVKTHSTAHHSDWVAKMMNAYNTYTYHQSTVDNSSHVTNTNSNNVVGSHNVSSNDVTVTDSHGVKVNVSSNQEATQTQANNSFNEDSYNTTTNTETNTSIVNDSYNTNTETNVITNSGNTSAETTNVDMTHVENSYNTENKAVNSGNTTNETSNTEVNTTVTENKTIDSYNTMEVEAVLPHEEHPYAI